MYLQKVISRNLFYKNLFFVGILKVIDEKSWIQDPDPLVRCMDPRIRIHTKLSWIRNTAFLYGNLVNLGRDQETFLEIQERRPSKIGAC
jgi:hypothetical protein